MGRTIKIKKLLLAALALGMIAMTMNGCVYANNKSWHDMTPEEQQEVRQEFLDDMKKDLEASFSDNSSEDNFLRYIIDNIEQVIENED